MSLNSIGLDMMIEQSGDTESIVFLSDLEGSASGTKVKVTGQVSDVTQRFTRDNRQFTIASLALMDGAAEIFIWNEDLQGNELWEEGRLVSVKGSVRLREDQMSISCTSVKEFIIPKNFDDNDTVDQSQDEPLLAEIPVAMATPANGYSIIVRTATARLTARQACLPPR